LATETGIRRSLSCHRAPYWGVCNLAHAVAGEQRGDTLPNRLPGIGGVEPNTKMNKTAFALRTITFSASRIYTTTELHFALGISERDRPNIFWPPHHGSSRCVVQRRPRYSTSMPVSRGRPPHHLHRPRRATSERDIPPNAAVLAPSRTKGLSGIGSPHAALFRFGRINTSAEMPRRSCNRRIIAIDIHTFGSRLRRSGCACR